MRTLLDFNVAELQVIIAAYAYEISEVSLLSDYDYDMFSAYLEGIK